MWQNKDGSRKKKKRIRPMSDKRRAENEVRSALLFKLLAERGNECEAKIEGVCNGNATDGHETLTRARGGSITDEENIKLVCRWCHGWIHENPAAAEEMGLLRSSYGRETYEPDQDADQ